MPGISAAYSISKAKSALLPSSHLLSRVLHAHVVDLSVPPRARTNTELSFALCEGANQSEKNKGRGKEISIPSNWPASSSLSSDRRRRRRTPKPLLTSKLPGGRCVGLEEHEQARPEGRGDFEAPRRRGRGGDHREKEDGERRRREGKKESEGGLSLFARGKKREAKSSSSSIETFSCFSLSWPPCSSFSPPPRYAHRRHGAPRRGDDLYRRE